MSYSNEQWRKAITKLLELTSNNKISWEPTDLYSGDVWSAVENSYVAKKDDKAYVVSEVNRKKYVDEEEFYWASEYVFHVYEKNSFRGYLKIATAPDISSVSSLFDAAQANHAYTSNALGGLI
ncbi:hypothetical protein Q4511_16225 [Paracoccus sp. 1_MG-2023]|uniref:hypothetical protein n=1 Tax=unclassified Paracoccus (in: a-proteobacteria) TaxID=2688777 RepID=UPI001C0A0527|nr:MULTISPECIES: hypothetical protein [unclassified Paracoccus (in: a-proteobacteria)]MBU2956795.1 hypothetical protein [Paracoccus sp. C2R09]MDO6670458.1 hypothetical protein [Paracoccus sp. 1_MG-2023]